MLLPDVNVLVDAHRTDSMYHAGARRWLEAVLQRDEAFGLSDLVCSGFIRVATHPRIFSPPSTIDDAIEFLEDIRGAPGCVVLAPGPRHWAIFVELCRTSGTRGNLVSDAYLAALAIETGSEWVTSDRDFARFPGLRWRLPTA